MTPVEDELQAKPKKRKPWTNYALRRYPHIVTDAQMRQAVDRISDAPRRHTVIVMQNLLDWDSLTVPERYLRIEPLIQAPSESEFHDKLRRSRDAHLLLEFEDGGIVELKDRLRTYKIRFPSEQVTGFVIALKRDFASGKPRWLSRARRLSWALPLWLGIVLVLFLVAQLSTQSGREYLGCDSAITTCTPPSNNFLDTISPYLAYGLLVTGVVTLLSLASILGASLISGRWRVWPHGLTWSKVLRALVIGVRSMDLRGAARNLVRWSVPLIGAGLIGALISKWVG